VGWAREDLRQSATVLESYAAGDAGGIDCVFDELTRVDARDAARERLFALMVRHVHGKGTEPLIVHCRLHPRVVHTQGIFRSREFLDTLARRLNVAAAPDWSRSCRVQGVEVLHAAGHLRYALFSDFLDSPSPRAAQYRGGLLFSVVADDYVNEDLAFARHLIPAVYGKLADSAALDRSVAHFLFSVFLVLHDALGHKCPYERSHPSKSAQTPFLLDSIEEFGADAQFFWASTASAALPFCREVLSELEIDALPLLWLVKRLCHYPRRGAHENFLEGKLLVDADARTGVLWWNFLKSEGVLSPRADHVDVDLDALPSAFEHALDAWLEVEAQVARGASAYGAALERFTTRYGTCEADEWRIPASLRAVR
jgi:hypothetical protein